MGEMLAAAINGNGLLWKTSPAVTELEQVTLGWLRQWSGLPEHWFGLIYDTASISSYARDRGGTRGGATRESRTRGAQSRLVVYTSEQSHSSIEKGAIAVGIGHDNVRRIAGGQRIPHAARRAGGFDRARPGGGPEAILRDRDGGHHIHDERGPGTGDRGHLRTARAVAARGRGVCRVGGDPAGVSGGRSRDATAPTRSSRTPTSG